MLYARSVMGYAWIRTVAWISLLSCLALSTHARSADEPDPAEKPNASGSAEVKQEAPPAMAYGYSYSTGPNGTSRTMVFEFGAGTATAVAGELDAFQGKPGNQPPAPPSFKQPRLPWHFQRVVPFFLDLGVVPVLPFDEGVSPTLLSEVEKALEQAKEIESLMGELRPSNGPSPSDE